MNGLYSLRNVKRFHGQRLVLDIDALDIAPGEIVGLSGPNGGGKTTLLRLLAILDQPDEGQIYFNGKLAAEDPQRVRSQVTLLNQEPYLLKRTVKTNVAYGLKIRRQANIEGKTDRAMEMAGLDPEKFGARHWYELSGGERQRVALAARLALEPRVLLLDEPTASLDRESANLVRKAALAAGQRWRSTLVIASHDLKWLEAVSSRILYLSEGRLGQNDDYFGS